MSKHFRRPLWTPWVFKPKACAVWEEQPWYVRWWRDLMHWVVGYAVGFVSYLPWLITGEPAVGAALGVVNAGVVAWWFWKYEYNEDCHLVDGAWIDLGGAIKGVPLFWIILWLAGWPG